MPFVGWCSQATRWDVDASACTVRLDVGFRRVSPEDGVFTTRLGGILELTLR